jgi:predicted DNA-binding transcriptional regulator AlpA
MSEVAMDRKRFLTAVEFAAMLGVSLQRGYEILRRNPDLAVRLGERQVRVDTEKLEAWITKGGARGGNSPDQPERCVTI